MLKIKDNHSRKLLVTKCGPTHQLCQLGYQTSLDICCMSRSAWSKFYLKLISFFALAITCRVAAVIHANRLKKYYDPNEQPIQPPTTLDNYDDQCLCTEEIPDDSFQNNDFNTDNVASAAQSLSFETEEITKNKQNFTDKTADNENETENEGVYFEQDDIFKGEKILKKKKKFRRGKPQYLSYMGRISYKRCYLGTGRPCNRRNRFIIALHSS